MKQENNPIIVTSIISIVVLVIALTALFTFSPGPSSKDTVAVQGTATIEATPDLISVYYNIETKGDTSSEAKDKNNEILNKLKSSIVSEGFSEDELKTQSFNVYPNYYWSGGRQTQDGYVATHSLKIELKSEDFDKISEVIDAGVNSGAGISYINFELSKDLQNQYKAQALELASKDAQIKADAVASGFGKKAGKLVSVSVSDFGYSPWNIYTAKSSETSGVGYSDEDMTIASESVRNLSPDEQEISASVSATFKLQ